MKDWRKSPEPGSMMGLADGGPPNESATPELASCSSPTSSPGAPFEEAEPAVSRVRTKADMPLADMARRVIVQKIHLFDSMGDAPFRLVRPILEQCAPKKLWSIEENSPHLIRDTDYIWRSNCVRDFKDVQQAIASDRFETTESWREVYRAKAVKDYEAKEAATAKIKQKYAMLQASKAASQVRVVTETPSMMRRHATRHGQGRISLNLTQGQRMLSKARRQAHSHSQAAKAPRSGELVSRTDSRVQTNARVPNDPQSPPASVSFVSLSQTNDCSGTSSGFERKASVAVDEHAPALSSNCTPARLLQGKRIDAPLTHDENSSSAKRPRHMTEKEELVTHPAARQSPFLSSAARSPSYSKPVSSKPVSSTPPPNKRLPMPGIRISTRRVVTSPRSPP